MNYYDITAIVQFSLLHNVDISPTDRQEWKMFACALKVLNFDEDTFVQMSHGSEAESRKAWRQERNPHKYKTIDQAKGMIVALARRANLPLSDFLLSPNSKTFAQTAQTAQTAQRPQNQRFAQTAQTAQTEICTNNFAQTAQTPDYLPPEMVIATERHAHETALFAYMVKEFGEEDTRTAFALYQVGGSKEIANGYRATTFPYMDRRNNVVDVKIFHVNPENGSRKSAPPLRTWRDREGNLQEMRSSWALAELNRYNRMNHRPELNRAPWCNFGDHLLPVLDDPVAIVESEKTALICSIQFPEYVWIAVGSKNNLTPNRCEQYKGRKVVLFPDNDAFDEWRTKGRELVAMGLNVSINPTIAQQGGGHDDLADLILRANRHDEGEQLATNRPKNPQAVEAEGIFADMMSNNPQLATLAQTLNLTPICVGYGKTA